MKRVLIAASVWFIFLNVLNVISLGILFDKTSYELPSGITIPIRHASVPWLNSDGRNYLKIATDGYDPKYHVDLRAFFPLYPILIRLLSFNFLFNPILTGLTISWVSFVAMLFVFEKILKQDRIDKDERFKILLSILIFPTSFYFIAYHTESFFLFLVLSTFYFLNKKKFLAASLLTAIATATRVTGLALVVPLAWEAFLVYKNNKKIEWSVIFAPLGFLAYTLYLQLFAGSALAVVDSQKGWDKPIGIFGPIIAIRDGFHKFIYGSAITRGDFLGRSMEILEFLSAVALILLIIYTFKKIKTSYWLYFGASIIPIFFSGVLSSIHRYMMVMFPIYLLIGALPKKYYRIYVVVSTILLAYLVSLYLRNYWVA